MNIFERAERIPPVICRLMARKNNGQTPLSNDEIAELSGLPRSTVADISLKTTWVGIPIDVAYNFSEACGVNFLCARRQVEWFKRSRNGFARYAQGNQSKFFVKLLKIAATIKATQT